MTSRIRQLVSLFPASRIDAFLVTKSVNITYLTGFPSEDSWLLVTSRRAFYITDARYTLEARRGLKGVAVRCYKKSFFDTVWELAKAKGVRRLGFDASHLRVSQFAALRKKAYRGATLVRADDLVESLRAVKERGEIAKIRKALALHKQAYALVRRMVRPGVTERAVLRRLEDFIRQKGVRFSFPPIIASGPNSCYPHARVTDRVFRRDEVVLVDCGIEWQGYKSDLTRMFFLGRIPKLIYGVCEDVKIAQRYAIDKVKPGIKAAEVDAAARGYLKKRKLAQYFGHALGHGVGLEIHESPRLAGPNTAVLKAGMVITIEPAVYIPNRFGIRIEDMVLVTPKGCEVLSDDID